MEMCALAFFISFGLSAAVPADRAKCPVYSRSLWEAASYLFVIRLKRCLSSSSFFTSGLSAGVRRTSVTRRLAVRVTTPSYSPSVNRSPTLGKWQVFSCTRPFTVLESISSSSGRPSLSYRSSTPALPSTIQLPSDCRRKSSVASSCSSQISPTSSSRISSSVMIPSVPPYSSTTTAM